MDNIESYRIDFDETTEEGVGLFGISLVDEPANESNFLKLSKDKIELKIKDKERQIVTGAVLIPNQKIFRNNESRGEHYIFFEEDVIERLSIDYFKKDADKNSWYNHNYDEKIEGNTVIESWIVEDENNDKSNALGLSLPKGTWVMSTKLSDENWKKYVKTGKVSGYSIDGMLKHELVKNKKEKEMTELFKNFVKFMDEKKEKEDVKMLEIKHEDKTLIVEELKEGKVVEFKDGDETKVFKEASFKFEDKEYTTDEGGKIISILEVKDDVKEDEKEDEPSLEEQKKSIEKMIDDEPEIKKMLEEIFDKEKEEKVEEIAELAEKDEDVKTELKKMFSKEMEELSKLKDEVTSLKSELSKVPNDTKLKMNKERKSNGKETTLEALSRINSKR